jgi:hypothetical protein
MNFGFTLYPDTSLHQVLMNDELVCMIMTELISIGGKANLVQAALASRAFLSPALEVLWETLDSPTPLLSLLPLPLEVTGRTMMVTPLREISSR